MLKLTYFSRTKIKFAKFRYCVRFARLECGCNLKNFFLKRIQK